MRGADDHGVCQAVLPQAAALTQAHAAGLGTATAAKQVAIFRMQQWHKLVWLTTEPLDGKLRHPMLCGTWSVGCSLCNAWAQA